MSEAVAALGAARERGAGAAAVLRATVFGLDGVATGGMGAFTKGGGASFVQGLCQWRRLGAPQCGLARKLLLHGMTTPPETP